MTATNKKLIWVIQMSYYTNKIITITNLLVKEPVNSDHFAFAERLETNPEVPKFKVGDKAKITNYKNIFSNSYTEVDQKKYL